MRLSPATAPTMSHRSNLPRAGRSKFAGCEAHGKLREGVSDRGSRLVALKAHEVERFLAKPPEGIRLFLVYGSDSGAITERARRLEQLALQRGRGDAVLRIGSDELSGEPGRVADEANSASLFGGEPVISLRVLDGRHNVVGALQPLFERPPEAAWVIVEAGELTPSNALRKAFEASKRTAALPTFQAEGKDLDALIRTAAEEHGVTIEPAALELLAENLGGDRLAIRGELEKLFLYAQDQRVVTLADVAAVVGDTTESHTDRTDRRSAARRQRGGGDRTRTHARRGFVLRFARRGRAPPSAVAADAPRRD